MSMRYKILGRSGLRVSELALGTMTFGDEWGWGAAADECRAMFDAYVEAGGNFIDTANKYTGGQAEKIVGDLIAKDRDAFVLSTKYTLATRNGDPNAAGNHRKNMRRAIEASLKRLRTDHIDLYYLHAWDFTTPADEIMRGLDDLVRSGKVLHVGISDAPAWVVAQCNTLAELRGWSRFVGIQMEYSLIERSLERDLLPMAESFDLGVLAWAPIGGGLLTGKYTRVSEDERDSMRAGVNTDRVNERNLAIARDVDAVAHEMGVEPVQVAIAWVRQQNKRLIPILGARKRSQLEGALASLRVTLHKAHLARLDEVSRIDLGFPHEFLRKSYIQDVVLGDQRSKIMR
ncbi:MAG: aldo/keto reductase [Myxococcales bacterium]|nr:aldo/keto reductase [Myxococcales bacterium]